MRDYKVFHFFVPRYFIPLYFDTTVSANPSHCTERLKRANLALLSNFNDIAISLLTRDLISRSTTFCKIYLRFLLHLVIITLSFLYGSP